MSKCTTYFIFPPQEKECAKIMTSSMIQKRRDLVNVQIRVDETITEPYAVLYTPELNEQINEMEKLIRGHGKEEFLLLEPPV